jgi:hypothetical protein
LAAQRGSFPVVRRWAPWLLALGCVSSPGKTDLAAPDANEAIPADAAIATDGALPPAPDLAPSPVPRVGPSTLTFPLDGGVFAPTASHPSVLLYVPRNFDPRPPLSVIAYIHGFNNCVENIVRDAGQACSTGGAVRNAYSLAAQLEASGKNALFVAPEVEFDQANGNPGNLQYPGLFKRLLQETLNDAASVIGPHTTDEIGELIVVSHSGGYRAADDIVTYGGLPVREVWMFDSLYNWSPTTTDFEAWAKQDLGSFRAPFRRFCSFYTVLAGCAGTDCNSHMMADDIQRAYGTDAGVVLDDRSQTTTWSDAEYHHGFLYKWSSLAHDNIPRYYFERMLSTSGLPAK